MYPLRNPNLTSNGHDIASLPDMLLLSIDISSITLKLHNSLFYIIRNILNIIYNNSIYKYQ